MVNKMVDYNPMFFYDILGYGKFFKFGNDVKIKISWSKDFKKKYKTFTKFKKILKYLKKVNAKVETLEINSHGSSESIDFDEQDVFMTKQGDFIYQDGKGNNSDVTEVFKAKLKGSEISLNTK